MNQNSRPLDTALAAALDDDSRSRTADAPAAQHPDLDAWSAYVENRLPDTEHERLQEHLVHCRECRELVLELDAFDRMDARATGDARTGDGANPESPRDAAAEAARTDALVAAVLERAEGRPEVASGRPAPSNAMPWRLAAAVLLAALLVTSFWGLALSQRLDDAQERLAEATRPTGATVLLDLYPADTRWRSDGGEVTIPTVDPADDASGGRDSGGILTWIVHLPPGVAAGPWTVELVGPEGDVLWRGDGLRADPEFHTLLVGAPRAFLERQGRHVLRLVPGDGGAAVAEYRFEVDGR